VLEFQRQQTLNAQQVQPLPRPMVQQPPPPTLPARTGLVQPAYPNASFAGDPASYEYMTAVQGYEPSLYYGGNVQSSIQQSQHVTGFPAFHGSVGTAQHSYVVPLTELGQQTEDFNYTAEQFGYNDDDYPENALSYEIADASSLPRLASRDVFMSGGETSSIGIASQPATIMPGFFANPVKQKLDEKFALPTVSQVGAKSTVEPTGIVSSSSDNKVPATVLSTGGSSLANVAKSTAVTSITAASQAAAGSVLSPPKLVGTSQSSLASVSQPATTAAAATVFGGFSFTSAPVITESKGSSSDLKKVANKEETKPANPFASFTFSQLTNKPAEEKKELLPTAAFGSFKFTSPSSVSKPTAKSDSKEQPSASSSQPVFGEATASQVPSFSTLATQSGSTTPHTFTKKSDGAGAFQGAGEKLFKGFGKSPTSTGRQTESSGKTGEEDEDGTGEDYVPDQEFKPLVSLPEVEVKTGEEDEVKLFGERAKLYRMDPDSKAWKERGIGEIKILRHPDTGKCRIVMRREQVLKLCANHMITVSMKLVPMKTSETSLCWVANDYSEGEFVNEQLCVKFKTVEQLQKFKSCFEACQASGSQCKAESTDGTQSDKTEADGKVASLQPATSSADQTSTGPKNVESTPLSSMFQAKAGQWDCTGCYIRNNADKVTCVACTTPKPGTNPVPSSTGVKQTPVSSASVPASVQSAPHNVDKTAAPLSSMFQAKAGQWDCSGCYVRNDADKMTCVACQTPKPGSTPSSNSSGVSQSTGTPAADSQFKLSATGGFTFGATSTPFKFAGLGSNSAAVGSTSKPSTVTETDAVTKPLFTSTFGQAATPAAAASSVGVSSASSVPSFNFKPFQQTSANPVSTVATASVSKTAVPAPVFTFGSASSAKPAFTPADTSKSSLFQTSASTPSFALLAETSATKPGNSSVLADSSKQGFGSQNFIFKGVTSLSSSLSSLTTPISSSLQSTTLTPIKKVEQAPASPSSPDGNELYVTGADDEPNVTFEPVCTLPDNVEVKTGEEDEDILYEHRAKLYRFADSEWKERGIGDVKILKHRDTGVIRIVMRRERVLKICMNHRITATMNLQPMPSAQGKAWMWYAADFADGPEPVNEKFSLKFKTEEIANSFKAAFDDAKDQTSRTGTSQASSAQTLSISDKPAHSTGRSILAGLLTSHLKEAPLGNLFRNFL
jgi:RanBP1 domain/Zn-finger in Ran binding protein and others